MDCDLINSNIGACTDKTSLGYNRIGWWCLYDDIIQEHLTIADNIVTVRSNTPFYEIYDGSAKPFDGSKVAYETSSQHGYQLSNQIVKFPLRPHTVENVQLVNALARGKRIVVILDQKGIQAETAGKYPIYGISGGLLLKTPISDWMTDVSWDLEFEDKNTSDNLLFADASSMAIVKSYDLIYGGTIANGGAVKLTIDSDKTGYVKLPNGTVLTTVAGIINTTYTGVGGAITYYVPKDSTIVDISTSGISGDITYNGTSELTAIAISLTSIKAINATYISAYANSNLHTVISGKVILLALTNCALTAKSIGDNLLAFAANNPTAIGTANFSGGTSALDTAIDAYLITQGTTLAAILVVLATWTITLNEA